jgi:hypothetical protein
VPSVKVGVSETHRSMLFVVFKEWWIRMTMECVNSRGWMQCGSISTHGVLSDWLLEIVMSSWHVQGHYATLLAIS